MTQFDPIYNRARAELTIPTEQGNPDLFLWEHANRVAHNAQEIIHLPAVQAEEPDPTAAVAAALYHDAGWAVRCRAGEAHRTEILLGHATEASREQGAAMLHNSLARLLSPESLELASCAIRTMDQREPDSIEGRIVAEANSLDELGVRCSG